MKGFKRRRLRSSKKGGSMHSKGQLFESSGIDEFAEELSDLIVHSLDEDPNFRSRPVAAGTSYIEAMGKRRAKEQVYRFQAAGESASRSHQEEGAANEDTANQELFLVEQHKKVVELVWAKYYRLIDVLGDAYVRRHPRERRWYYARMLFLLIGDLVGVAGGAITMGEIPWLAALQALAAGFAAVTAGVLGSDIKDSRLVRQRKRDPESLPHEHKQYAHLFQGPDGGEFLVRMMVVGALAVIFLLGAGIFMLRTSTEGSISGMVFACLSMSVGLASFANSYHYADEMADKVEQAEELALRTTEDHKKLMAMSARSVVARAKAAEKSITREHESLGQAAKDRVNAMVHAWHAGQANIFGHGFLPEVVVPEEDQESEQDESTEDDTNVVDIATLDTPSTRHQSAGHKGQEAS